MRRRWPLLLAALAALLSLCPAAGAAKLPPVSRTNLLGSYI
jgi:hypothetical protein